jgi:uroporphyrinogen-III synthase
MSVKTIILTSPQSTDNELTSCLETYGFKVLPFPTIEIVFNEPNFKTESLPTYSHLVFTSQNGVNGFFRMLNKTLLPAKIKLVTIGKKTAQSIEQYGYKANIIAKRNTAGELAQELLNQHLTPSDTVLVSVGKKAGTEIEQTISPFCKTTRIDVYNTIEPTEIDSNTLQTIKSNSFEMLVFTSPSTFENFITITHLLTQQIQCKIACIGKTTAKRIKEMGYEPTIISTLPEAKQFAKEIAEILLKK